MLYHKAVTLLFRLESLIIISALMLMPIAGHALDLKKTPVRKTAPVKTQSKPINPRQARAAAMAQPVCAGAPLPDIDVTDLRLSGSGKQGKAHQVTVDIINGGQCATGKFSIKASMRIQGQGIDKVVQLGRKGVPSLKPCRKDPCSGASSSVVFRFTPQYNHALYGITVEADPGNNINEFRENNNSAQVDLRIQNY